MSAIINRIEKHLSLLVAAAVTVIVGGGIIATGLASGWESRTHLGSIMPSVRFLCSTVIAANATILSLLLALISFSQSLREEHSLKGAFFQRIRVVGRAATGTLIFGTIILSLISIPLDESDSLSTLEITTVYYVILAAVALLSGALVYTITLLYRCVSNLIDIVHPDVDSGNTLVVESVDEDSSDS